MPSGSGRDMKRGTVLALSFDLWSKRLCLDLGSSDLS